MYCPGDTIIQIFAQRQLTKINLATSVSPTFHLRIWHALWSLSHAFCQRRIIFLWIHDWNLKSNFPPLQPLCLVWPQNAHWQSKNPSNNECIFFLNIGFFNIWTLPLTDHTKSTLSLQKNKLRNRDLHVRTKNTPSAIKQRSSKWKEDFSPSPITSDTWEATSHTLFKTVVTLTHP